MPVWSHSRPSVRLHVLGVHRGRGAPRERLAVPERAADAGEDLPVRQRLAGRVERALRRATRAARSSSSSRPSPATARRAAARARARRSRSGSRRPGRSRARRGAAPRRSGPASGWETTGLVATIHSTLTRPLLERLDQLGGRQARLGRDPRRVPEAPHLGAVLGVGDLAVAGQQASRARRSRARPSRSAGRSATAGPSPGRPMLPVARQRLMSARFFSVPTRRLVGAHRPQRHRALGGAEPARGGDDVLGGDAAHLGARARASTRRRSSARPRRRACGARGSVRSSRPSRSSTCSIAFSSGRSVPGRTGRCRSACSAVGVRRGSATIRNAPLAADPVPHDRVAGRGVGAEQEQHVGLVDVGVGRRRAVGAERARVARDRAGHAQARVGVDVVGAEEALGQLVDRVVVLGQQLAGDVERDLVGLDVAAACARSTPIDRAPAAGPPALVRRSRATSASSRGRARARPRAAASACGRSRRG